MGSIPVKSTNQVWSFTPQLITEYKFLPPTFHVSLIFFYTNKMVDLEYLLSLGKCFSLLLEFPFLSSAHFSAAPQGNA